jgi:tight adherence protein B
VTGPAAGGSDVAAMLMAGAAWLATGPRALPRKRLARLAERGLQRPRNSPLPASWRLMFPVLLAIFGLVAVVGLAAAVGLLVAGASGWALAGRARARHREQLRRVAVVELIRAVAAELRCGRTSAAAFRAAVDAAAPQLREALLPAADFAARGDLLDVCAELAALTQLPAAGSLRGLTRLVACWRVAATSGATLASAVDRVADALHDELELERALRTTLAGPRATVRLLAGLPVAGLVLATAIGARPLAFLFGSTAGACCTLGAGLLDTAGVLWARGIAVRALRAG